ncbi:response regulator transcription factor [Duganella dendranthematis]|jgi:FixJ family two-component response regulator|uniref:Response regulator transcription factor n=1 Tax=Duganella dendranthematis TaxID=2728021 RepID=A0ABX6MEE8_9BURK|nr:response regulator transcription factor [Duganella dendranthematis]QJD92683.1 response regulator transcription factor [Duganella dendranthematis]
MNQIDYSDALVYIVDDEAQLRDAISSLLRSVGMQVAAFPSVAAFLAEPRRDLTSCLLLDVRLQGLSGLDFQAELNRDGVALPIIFMTGHGDIPMSVRAMKAGAVDFLAKPFRDQDLLDAIHTALAADQARRLRDQASDGLTARYATLTPREREIMALAARGLMNKQIAGEVGTSEITVKIHRGNAMRKMQAKTFADLVRMAEALGLAKV